MLFFFFKQKTAYEMRISDWSSDVCSSDLNLRAAVLIPDREWLYERCDRRFDEMIACGAAAEVAALLARGLSPTLPVMRAIGVPELAAYVRDEIDLETAAAAARQATRNYAKRQLTWFRNQPPESWSRAASAEEAAALMLDRKSTRL